MPIDISPVDPPNLEQDPQPGDYEDVDIIADTDYRREELATYLQEGAWKDAFSVWADETEMTEYEFAIVRELGLIEEFDFFWDDFADRVGYHAPGIPEDWRERDLHPALESWETVSTINASLTELGQLVCDILKDEYIEWEASYEAPDDLPEF